MVKRNEAWRNKKKEIPPGRYVVAVGALHLYGEGNLPQKKKKKNGQYFYWPVKEEFHHYYYPEVFTPDPSIVAQSCRNCQDLMRKIILFFSLFPGVC